jgi:hypothetical protein
MVNKKYKSLRNSDIFLWKHPLPSLTMRGKKSDLSPHGYPKRLYDGG